MIESRQNMTTNMENTLNILKEKLPDWAVKPHPTKSNMSVIHPMAVVDRLNEVFGVGKWQTEVEKLSSEKWNQKTTKGERVVYTSTSRVTFKVPSLDIHLEQFGGSTNDDEGDALKGSATDGLTKIASYLGVGAEIYKGHGNVSAGEAPQTRQDAPGRIGMQNMDKVLSEPKIHTVTEDEPLDYGVGVRCAHNEIAKKVQTKKPGPNKGRYFYTCARPMNEQCKFFQWETEGDEPLNVEGNSSDYSPTTGELLP